MRLGILFSGGKDSAWASRIARSYGHDLACLLTVRSRNPESYLYHTPNIHVTPLQAEAMGLPLLVEETAGEAEAELEELRILLERAKRECAIQGVVTGALHSIYQATRIERVCAALGLLVFSPSWQRDEAEHVAELLAAGCELVVAGIAAHPLDERWLGRRLVGEALCELRELQLRGGVSPAGEGGELETLALWMPGWRKRVVVDEARVTYERHAGSWSVTNAHLELVERTAEPYRWVPPAKGGVLVVSLCTEPLAELEYVRPLVAALERAGKPCTVIQAAELTNGAIAAHDAVILSGAPLLDDAFRERDWRVLVTARKPVLAICAGAQALALAHGGQVEANEEIGLVSLEGDGTLLPRRFDAYALHRHAATPPPGFTALARSTRCVHAFRNERKLGLLFHPEVRNASLIPRLLEMLGEG